MTLSIPVRAVAMFSSVASLVVRLGAYAAFSFLWFVLTGCVKAPFPGGCVGGLCGGCLSLEFGGMGLEIGFVCGRFTVSWRLADFVMWGWGVWGWGVGCCVVC